MHPGRIADFGAGPYPLLRPASLADIESLADEAFARLPAAFRTLCDGVVFRVEDFPDAETLRHMGCRSEFDLLLDYWAEHVET